ncbi:MAG: hypothetical protein AB1921_16115 [Thermodesulfobacteriota bacterium]
MNGEGRTMDQRIFSMGLSVEAVSLYLLCCGLTDQGATVSRKNLAGSWTGTEEGMELSFVELAAHGIVKRILSDGEKNEVFRVMPSDHWR